MSRIGKKPIVVPEGVTYQLDGNKFDCERPKRRITQSIR